MRVLALMLLTTSALLGTRSGEAGPATLTVTGGAQSREFTTAALLARADTVSLVVEHDVSYGHTVTYRAVPLSALPPVPRPRALPPRTCSRASCAVTR